MTTSKKLKLKLILVGLFCAVFSGAVCSYATYSFMSEFFLYGFYTSETAKATIELSALRALRSGDTKKAINILEVSTWGSLVLLENSKTEAPKAAHPSMNKTLNSIRHYETEFGVKLEEEAKVENNDS